MKIRMINKFTMQKTLLLCIIMLVSTAAIQAQSADIQSIATDSTTNSAEEINRFTIGLRGGFASAVDDSKNLPVGFDTKLDLLYTHYWSSGEGKYLLGISTGVSIGYMNVTRNQNWDETFTLSSTDGDIEYHITASNICEKNNQIQLEIPLMYSMVTRKGLFFNIGPRFSLPIYASYEQSITGANVVAKDIETGVMMTNNPVYGFLTEEQINTKGRSKQQFALTIALGFEMGYEFKLQSGNSMDIGFFANYGLYQLNGSASSASIFEVTTPNSTPGCINVSPLTNAITNQMGSFDVGIKLSLNLDYTKQ